MTALLPDDGPILEILSEDKTGLTVRVLALDTVVGGVVGRSARCRRDYGSVCHRLTNDRAVAGRLVSVEGTGRVGTAPDDSVRLQQCRGRAGDVFLVEADERECLAVFRRVGVCLCRGVVSGQSLISHLSRVPLDVQ